MFTNCFNVIATRAKVRRSRSHWQNVSDSHIELNAPQRIPSQNRLSIERNRQMHWQNQFGGIKNSSDDEINGKSQRAQKCHLIENYVANHPF